MTENFDSFDHKTIYGWMHAGDTLCTPEGNIGGAKVEHNCQQAWDEFKKLMVEANQDVKDALAKASLEWEGAASASMQGGVMPLAQWAEDVHTAGGATGRSLEGQNTDVMLTANKVPPPVQVSSTANNDFLGIPAGFTHLFGGQTDQDIQEQKAKEEKAKAVRAMQSYNTQTSGNTTALGQFTPPPSTTLEVPPPTPVRPPIGDPRGGVDQNSPGTEQPRDGHHEFSRPPTQGTDAQGHQIGPGITTGQEAGPLPTPTPPIDDPSRPRPPVGPTPGIGAVGILPGTGPGFRPGDGSNHIGSGVRSTTGGLASGGVGSSTRGGAPGFGGGAGGIGAGGQRFGPGGPTGIGQFDDGAHPQRNAAGARGAVGQPAMGMGGAPMHGQNGQQDREHKRPDYLVETDPEVWGTHDIKTVVPVIGATEDPYKDHRK